MKALSNKQLLGLIVVVVAAFIFLLYGELGSKEQVYEEFNGVITTIDYDYEGSAHVKVKGKKYLFSFEKDQSMKRGDSLVKFKEQPVIYLFRNRHVEKVFEGTITGE